MHPSLLSKVVCDILPCFLCPHLNSDGSQMLELGYHAYKMDIKPMFAQYGVRCCFS